MRLHLTLTVEHPDGSEDRHHWVNVPGAVAEVLREVCGEPAGKTYAPVPVSDTEPRDEAEDAQPSVERLAAADLSVMSVASNWRGTDTSASLEDEADVTVARTRRPDYAGAVEEAWDEAAQVRAQVRWIEHRDAAEPTPGEPR